MVGYTNRVLLWTGLSLKNINLKFENIEDLVFIFFFVRHQQKAITWLSKHYIKIKHPKKNKEYKSSSSRIVGSRNKVLAAEPRGEWGGGLWNTACTKTMGFWIVRTPVCGKNGLVERSRHVNQMLDDPSYIFQGYTLVRLWRQAFTVIDFVSSSKEQCESIRPFRFAINTLSWVVCLPHKFSTFNSAEKCGTRGVIISWLTSKSMFSLSRFWEIWWFLGGRTALV